MKRRVTTIKPSRRKAEQGILDDMRRIRGRLDDKLCQNMEELAKNSGILDEMMAPQEKKEPEKEEVKVDPDTVPYDRDQAMKAVGKFMAMRKDDPAFMQKMLKLFRSEN